MKNNKKKFPFRLLWIVLTLICITFLTRVYFWITDDIRIANMVYELPYYKEWEIPPLTPNEKEQLDAVLSQKFYYIGKGTQSYAFSSEDDQYVIKFFKFKHLRPNWFIDSLPSISPFTEYRCKQTARKQKKLYRAFAGYHLAYEVLREDSGLLFIHLNKSHDLHKTVTLVDKIGLEHHADLDKMVFFIQKKVQTTRQRIDEAMKKGDLVLAKNDIRKIFDLYLSEYQKGIYDLDHGVMHNTGFADDKPIHLDVGMLTKKESMRDTRQAQNDLALIVRKFRIWFNADYPEASSEMMEDIDSKMKEIFESHQDKN